MESKILIDINYASREPQIIIQHKISDDPRDKLIAMLTGEAMPGVRDGYCRIERTESRGDVDYIAITALHPVNALKHIPAIRKFAVDNVCIDTADGRKLIETQNLEAVDAMCIGSLSPDLYGKWEEVVAALKQNRKAFS